MIVGAVSGVAAALHLLPNPAVVADPQTVTPDQKTAISEYQLDRTLIRSSRSLTRPPIRVASHVSAPKPKPTVRTFTTTSSGNRAIGQKLAAAYGWTGQQWVCLNELWTRESNWRSAAHNPSGATGIPQALPGSKMASAGPDWRTNPATQIRWGLTYIKSNYGTPCGAWGHELASGWY